MRAFIFAVACLACISYGRTEEKIAHVVFNREADTPSRAFSNFLLALNPGIRSASRPVSVHAPSRAIAPSMDIERTYIMIKPDGVQRGLIGEIIKRFEQRGYKLNALKLYQASEELLRTHYSDLVEKPFFPSLLGYMLSGPVTCMVWEGENAVKMGRQMLGETNPQASLPGTIRGDFSIVTGRNICHGSDSVENAEKEIALWFKEDELVSWKSHSFDWVNEV
mmetsp:Transcript_12534/g.19981  ORF Transcript_12534/g.19981 Transcript_12534/m.19981 type:complete len:222 (-) Transcript_12534:115-780(-)|eukprot:CAMPEP_0169274274 /NCGR_PEP_ID=MMETSP1016-20121227/51626_1 /TAXON_ID=342587 /ORGANISM="Karlodinium micrum, Strain CCMP2283" /LENGTH=221 /DNA_ID=CAMNT_0009360801 /DNA_START=41 /DNA_END=706 /DNA_ORIENTATION=+